MGRKAKRKQIRQKTQKNSSLEDLMPNLLQGNHIESRYSPDSLKNLRKELKEAITQIYSKFKERFMQMVSFHSQYPSVQISVQELVIEKNYCNELTQKVKQLVHLDSLTDIYNTFCKSVINFNTQISAELQHTPPNLLLPCLIDAYAVLLNSSRELGKVTSGIFESQSKYITCDTVSKLAFLDNVLKVHDSLIKASKASELQQNLARILNDLTELSERTRNSKSQEGKNHKIRVSDPSLDEIVRFINGQKSCSKVSTAETSPRQKSAERDFDKVLLDKEIKEFQDKLDRTRPSHYRLKPSLSEEWLKKIKKQIQREY